MQNINENKVEIIEKILPNINFDFFNFSIINTNIDTLIKIFQNIQPIFNNLPNNLEQYNFENNISDPKEKNEFIKHYENYLKMVKSERLNLFKWNKIFIIRFQNLKFFYLYDNISNLNRDKPKILFMLKIFITMEKYFTPNNNKPRYVIWIPINSDRDFLHEHINSENLKQCVKEYKAFTVSGVTHSIHPNPRITVITRYEEIEKLLIHELVHNLYLDGSNYHIKLESILDQYNQIKKSKNYNYEYSMYESYTELLSTYLYLLFINMNKTLHKLKKILFGQILIEIIYSYNTIVNIAKLNKYKNYKDFIQKEELYGSICFYEYYYVKGLLYNNLVLTFPKNFEEFVKLYKNIFNVIIKSYQDKLLEHMFVIYQKQKNYKYIFN